MQSYFHMCVHFSRKMTAAHGKKENEIVFNKEKIFSNQIDNVMQKMFC